MTTLQARKRSIAIVAALTSLLFAGCVDDSSSAIVPTPMTHFRALLLPDPYTTLRFVLFPAEDFGGAQIALDALKATAENVTEKAVEVDASGVLPAEFRTVRTWTVADLYRLVRESPVDGLGPGQYGRDNEAIVGVYYLPGNYADGHAVMIDGRIILFQQDREGRPDAFHVAPKLSEANERHLLIHEFGHAIGLVNCGLPMVRPHQGEGLCHSSNASSVMYPGGIISPQAVAADDWMQWRFDADDLADIRAFREANS